MKQAEDDKNVRNIFQFNSPKDPYSLLIGVSLIDNKEKTDAVSPVHYVSKDNPPFLILHGTHDALALRLEWLRANRAAPQLLIGHSLGGAAILAAAARIPEAKAVATIAAPSDPSQVTGLFGDHIDAIREHEAFKMLSPHTQTPLVCRKRTERRRERAGYGGIVCHGDCFPQTTTRGNDGSSAGADLFRADPS